MNTTKTKLLTTAVLLLATAATQTFANVIDFSDFTAGQYYVGRSDTQGGADCNVYANDAITFGYSWANTDYSYTDVPNYVYSWEGILVSNEKDTSIAINYEGNSTFTSITGKDADGEVGGNYAVIYAPAADPYTWMPYENGISKSDMGNIMFNELVNVSSISLSNTLNFVNYFESTNPLDDKVYEDTYWENVLIYGIDSNGEILKDNAITASLSSPEAGVLKDWLEVDISGLNVEDGLYGLYFEMQTDDFGVYGANSPSYFAFDNIKYSSIAVPEPSEWAAIFGGLALALAVYRKRKS